MSSSYSSSLLPVCCWLFGDHLIFEIFEPYAIIFTNVCIVITVAMVMVLREFGQYGIIYMILCLLLCCYC
jgi:hypothetical protein